MSSLIGNWSLMASRIWPVGWSEVFQITFVMSTLFYVSDHWPTIYRAELTTSLPSWRWFSTLGSHAGRRYDCSLDDWT
jgi:hypothetical protein